MFAENLSIRMGKIFFPFVKHEDKNVIVDQINAYHEIFYKETLLAKKIERKREAFSKEKTS